MTATLSMEPLDCHASLHPDGGNRGGGGTNPARPGWGGGKVPAVPAPGAAAGGRGSGIGGGELAGDCGGRATVWGGAVG